MYQELYEKDFNTYNEMLEEYEKNIASGKYFEVIHTMPFRFLNAVHLCEQLDLYNRCNPKPKMYFNSYEEAYLFYKNLITFKQTTKDLLDCATYIVEVDKKREMINTFVKDSLYLDDNLSIVENETIADIAKRCVSYLPKYPQLVTKEFRWNFVESCIICMNQDELGKLVDTCVIKNEDIDNINLTETINNYQKKISFLCKKLGREEVKKCTIPCKIKGVTFANDDGSSRQENLKELRKYMDENPNEKIQLQTENYIYTPEIGEPEPAVRILWRDKCIGNLSKSIAAELQTKYKENQYEIEMERVVGGTQTVTDNPVYGCTIKLTLYTPLQKIKDIEEELEK